MTGSEVRRANPRRGEIEADLGGRRLVLCLTLGALAELEGAFGVEGLDALGRRLAGGGLSARDLIRLIGAGARGAGAPVSDEEIAALPLAGGLAECVDTAARLLDATFAGGGQEQRRGSPIGSDHDSATGSGDGAPATRP